jgi:hypothetical protein
MSGSRYWGAGAAGLAAAQVLAASGRLGHVQRRGRRRERPVFDGADEVLELQQGRTAVSRGRVLPDEPVHGLPDEVGVPDVPRVLLDQVHENAPQAR